MEGFSGLRFCCERFGLLGRFRGGQGHAVSPELRGLKTGFRHVSEAWSGPRYASPKNAVDR